MSNAITRSRVARAKRATEMTGGCACGNIRYKLTQSPLIVHACHCRDCQRITGSAFVINLWIEKEFLELTSAAAPKRFRLAGGTGQHHDVFFCDRCGTYVWSDYQGAPNDAWFVRAGTLDKPDTVKPDVHIFTRSKVPWLELPRDAPAFKVFYRLDKIWPPESLARLKRKAK
ncbi:MAG: GFA family protein [Candidatus Binataceae bacterium]